MKRSILRLVLRDMAYQLRSFPRRNRQGEQTEDKGWGSGWFFWVYLCTFFPVLTHAYDTVEYGVVYWCGVLPLLSAGLLGRACVMRLPRMMYLCPLEQAERRRYMAVQYVVKLAVVLLCCAVFQAVPLALGYCGIGWSGAVMLAALFLSMGLNLPWSGMAYAPVNVKGSIPQTNELRGYRTVLTVQQVAAVTFYICLLLPFVKEERSYGTTLLLWCSLIAGLFLFFITGILLCRYWNALTEQMVEIGRGSYETGAVMTR